MPRTRGTSRPRNAPSVTAVALPQSLDVFALCPGACAARATESAVERFYTTVVLLREHATEGWHASTLMTKEN